MSLGVMEILVIVFAVILLFGTKKIPEIARQLGRVSYEYKKAKETIESEAETFTSAVDRAEKAERNRREGASSSSSAKAGENREGDSSDAGDAGESGPRRDPAMDN